MRIAVIGAGWAGLAAAVELARSGVEVVLFEAGRVAGGRARELAREGRILDNGLHVLAGAYTETLRMMRAVGIEPERALLRIPLAIVVPGRLRLKTWPLPAPFNLLAGLAFARGLSLASRIAAARFLPRLERSLTAGGERTVGEALAACGQDGEPARLIWEPLCRAALNTPVRLASARVFARVLRDTLGASRAASDLLLPRVSLGELFPAPALRFLGRHGGAFLASTPIRAVARVGCGLCLEGDPRAQVHDAVILATAPQAAARLLAGLSEAAPAIAIVDRFAYHPIATCYLQYPAGVELPAAMIGGGPEGADWYFDRGRLRGEPGLIATVVSADAERMKPAGAAAAARAHQRLARLLGPLPRPSWSFTVVEKRAGFSCTPHLDRPAQASGIPGLWLAGDYTDSPYPATIEAAVRSGVTAARAALGR